jgi:GDP-4-dehydro-6-deoxy-D-mannose reductase
VKSTVLITGASGFAGSHLLERLASAAVDLIAWRRPAGRAGEPSGPAGVAGLPAGARVTWEEVDLLDRPAVQDALARIRPAAVYHCAGAAHVGRSWNTTETTLAVNVRGTHHLIEALRASGNTSARVLLPSSSLVYAPSDEPSTEEQVIRPGSPYALSKLAQELVGTGNPGGPPVLIARAFNHVGARQDPWFALSGFARRIADIEAGRWEPEIAVGNLEARRDLTDVRDTVRAYQLIVERGTPGRPYNVCSGRAVAIGEVLDMLLARARRVIRVRTDPARYRPNDQPIVVGDPRRIRTELGWSAEIPLEQTLEDLLEYWRRPSAFA